MPPVMVKGHPKMGGRAKGTTNKRITEMRQVYEEAFRRIGGIERLVAWIKADERNEFAFHTTMMSRLLPVRVMGSGPRGEVELNVTVKAEELEQRLEHHGLPRAVFGNDVPVLELEAVKEPHPVKGNGKDDG